MPQYFQVLRCYKCSIFQVHQVKKSNKFECKLCGEKQSIKRHYGVGTGKECRLHVQKLNGIRGDIDNLKNSISSDDENFDDIENINTNKEQVINVKTESKWSNYIEEPEVCSEENINGDMCLGDAEVVLEKPAKRCKFARNNTRYNKRGSHRYKAIKDSDELSPEESATEDPTRKYSPIDVLDSSIKFESEINPTSRKTVPKKFVLPTCSKQSKWAQFTDETNENLSGNHNPNGDTEREIFPTKNSSLETKPIVSENNTFRQRTQRNETVNKFSKWDFHEDIEKPSKIIPKFNVPVPVSKFKNQTQKLFSLCSDNDLDNILDI